MSDAVQQGDKVKVQYTGKLESGEVFDQSQEGQGLEFTAGSQDMIAGFSKAVIGMSVGESKTVTLQPDEAYGQRHEQLVMEVPRAQAPENVEVGQQLVGTSEEGQQVPLMVVGVDEEIVTVDGNHPLAGQVLVFDVTLESLERT